MIESDKALLEAARGGDARALEQLLARHEKQVYRFGLRMCGSEDAAREVLQETLLAAFRGLRDFRGEAALSTWLYQIARSYCIKARRRRVDEPESHASLDSPSVLHLADQAPGPEAAAQARQVGEVLQAAILALPEQYREALVLRDVEGLTAEEAAQAIGIEVPALKSRLHRARMEVRRHLGVLMQGPAGPPGCPELAQSLTEYAAQEIDQATCARIEAHLAQCPRCVGACDSLRQTVSLCRRIPGGEVPPQVRSAVRQALGAFATGG